VQSNLYVMICQERLDLRLKIEELKIEELKAEEIQQLRHHPEAKPRDLIFFLKSDPVIVSQFLSAAKDQRTTLYFGDLGSPGRSRRSRDDNADFKKGQIPRFARDDIFIVDFLQPSAFNLQLFSS
jgi:hypothetical protein